MTFKKGQSGNPDGRPRKGYALTDLLEARLNKSAPDIDGKNHANKRILARVAIEAATTGSVTFPKAGKDGRLYVVTEKLEARDWITWAKYIIDRVDGPAKQRFDVTTDDESLNDTGTLTDDRRAALITAILEQASDKAARSGDSE